MAPNDTNRELSNPGETLSLFPSEINDARPHPSVGRTTRALPLDTDVPIAFESVRVDPSLITADAVEPPRQAPSRGMARLAGRMRKLQHLPAIVFRPSQVDAFRGVRLWPFAIVFAGIVTVNALRSVDRSPQNAMGPESSQTAIVTAALPEVAIPEPTRDYTPAVDARPATPKRPTPPPISERSKPRRPVPATQFSGHLIIDSEPKGAAVMINQRLVGVTPLEISPYPASSYAVWVQQDGYERWTAGVLVAADKVTRVHARLQKSP